MSYNDFNLHNKYSQNEMVNKKLMDRLVNQSSITEGDLVYDWLNELKLYAISGHFSILHRYQSEECSLNTRSDGEPR